MSVDQQTTTLAERTASSRERVQQLHTDARKLADRLSRTVPSLGGLGQPIPTAWFDDYAAWVDDVERLTSSWEAEPAFDAYRPVPADSCNDLSQWDDALTRFQQDQETALAERRRQIAEHNDLLERVLDLSCATGESAGLHELQMQARRCRDELDAANQAAETTDPALDTEGAAETYALFEALWGLACDAHDDGLVDDESSIERGERLQEAVGLELVMKVCQGKIAPRSGWSVETSRADGGPIADSRETLPVPIAAPHADVVASEEAIARLKWAQSPDDVPLEPTATPTPPKPINTLALDSLRSRVRSAADSARHMAEADNDVIHHQLADGFEALHSAICYTLSVFGDRPANDSSPQMAAWLAEFHSALQSVATSQSALRKFHIDRDWTPCSEQDEVYYWLNATTDHPDACFLHHMKLDQPADPAEMVDLKRHVDAARYKWERPKRQQKLGKKVQYEIGQMTGDAEADRPRWETIVSTVDHLLTEEKVQPSNTDLREILLPRYDDFPDDLDVPTTFRSVLRAIDEYQANREAEEAKRESLAGDLPVSPHVAEVARLLNGKKLVMVGGVCNEEARQRIEQALGLSTFEWLETREHESTEKFRPHLTSPDVFLVCLLVRWCGHQHIDSLKDFCRDAGKHCIIMPRGYNLERVAHDVLDQCGHRLRFEATQPSPVEHRSPVNADARS